MHVQPILISLFIRILQIMSVTAITTTIGRYKLSRRSPNLTQCTSELMSKQKFKSFLRVQELTGQCESMSGPWDEENPKPGYEYAKLIDRKESFRPSKSAKHWVDEYFYFPNGSNAGMNYSLIVTWPQMTWDAIYFSMYTKASGYRKHYFFMSIDDRGKYINLSGEPWNITKSEYISYDDIILPGSRCIISFVSNGNTSIKIMFNGVTMGTWEAQQPSCFDLKGILKIFLKEHSYASIVSFQIHGTEYIAGSNSPTNCSL